VKCSNYTDQDVQALREKIDQISRSWTDCVELLTIITKHKLNYLPKY